MEQIVQGVHKLSVEDTSENDLAVAMAQGMQDTKNQTYAVQTMAGEPRIRKSNGEPSPSHSKTILVSVAIDFGTTYSGYAYSTLSDFKRDPLQMFANEAWTAATGQCLLSKKTPTCLLLSPEKKFIAFGYDAEDQFAELVEDNRQRDYYFFKRFKMRLHGEENIPDVIEDVQGKPATTLTVFSESIGYLKRHFLNQLETRGFNMIKKEEIRWVLTVPAIWSDFAKRFMREAAIKAGIPRDNLLLALEPEAASLYCQHIYTQRTEEGFSVTSEGTKFMVVDLGGGTADITVQEKVKDGKLKEICRATGGPLGGTAVDEAFVKLLGKLIGDGVINRLRVDHVGDYMEMLREFEVSKRSLNSKSNTLTMFNVRIPATLFELCQNEHKKKLVDVLIENDIFKDKIKLKGDKLRINLNVVILVFMNVLDEICSHIQQILEAEEGKNISVIELVGGFSESPFVQETIKDKFQTDKRWVLVPQDAGIAVVKGAVIFGHMPTSIESRIVRYTYGNAIKVLFEEGVHDEDKKFIDGEKTWCRNIFKPFMIEGTSVKIGHQFVEKKNVSNYDTARMRIFVTDRKHVKYVTDEGCREVCNVSFSEALPSNLTTKQRVKQVITFGDTELHITLKNLDTKMSHKLTVKHSIDD